MEGLDFRKILIVIAHAVVGWILCGATVGIGFALTTERNALIFHALAVPVIFYIISMFYTKKYAHVNPLGMALIFISTAMILDFFIVALLVNRSLDMFRSPIGTWIPFVLIFLTSYGAGTLTRKRIGVS